MYFRFLPLIGFVLLISCQNNPGKISYPITEKVPVVDTYFDTEVIDNYRWLEDDNA